MNGSAGMIAEAIASARSYKGSFPFMLKMRKLACTNPKWVPTQAQAVAILKSRARGRVNSPQADRTVDWGGSPFNRVRYSGPPTLDPTPRLLFALLNEEGGWEGPPGSLGARLREKAEPSQSRFMPNTEEEWAVRLNRLRAALIDYGWGYRPSVFVSDEPVWLYRRRPGSGRRTGSRSRAQR